MADEDPFQKAPVLPYDSDGYLIELLWSRLSGAMWRYLARGALQPGAAGALTGTSMVWLSPTELQALLALLRDRARLNQHLIAKFEAALEAAG